MPFIRKSSPLYSLNLVYYSHYLFQKANLYLRVYFNTTCLFLIGVLLFFTCVDWFTKYCRLIPCFFLGSFEYLFSCKAFCANTVKFFGIPGEVIQNKDPRFTGRFGRSSLNFDDNFHLLKGQTLYKNSFNIIQSIFSF